MSELDPLLIAEDAQAYRVAWPNQVRYDAGDAVLFHGAPAMTRWGRVSRIRFDATTIDRRIDEVRAWFAARQRDEFLWTVGASATPADLTRRLGARGAQLHPREPLLVPMVLDHEPPSAATVEVRRVDTVEDYRLAWELDFAGAGVPEEMRAPLLARLVDDWPYFQADPNQIAYIASIDGIAVAYALLGLPMIGPPFLAGAATMPAGRGRGAYRALVRARWDEAVRRGTPALIAQVPEASRPILEGLGFRGGPPIHVLLDHSSGRS